jgi:hypothetical protein
LNRLKFHQIRIPHPKIILNRSPISIILENLRFLASLGQVPGHNHSNKTFAPKAPGPRGVWSWKLCQIRIPHPKITLNRHPYCWNHSYKCFAPRVPGPGWAWSWKFYQIRIPHPKVTLNRHQYCWNHSNKIFAPKVPGPRGGPGPKFL